MKKETIRLDHGQVEVLVEGNLVYLNVFGEYTDGDALAMTKYLDRLFTEMDGPVTRVWDSTNIPEGGYKLTSHGTDEFAAWSRKIREKWPQSMVYLIANRPVIYGVSRMYGFKASDDETSTVIVRSFAELPKDIRNRIQTASNPS